MSKFFVWLNGSLGPEEQIWHDMPKDGNGKLRQTSLFQHQLDESEENLSLDELILKFKDKV